MEEWRYRRQIALPELGADGQRRLRGARVLVAGAGGLGAPVLSYLAAAGVGTLGIADFDAVELSNLPRQVIYATPDVGTAKTVAASRRINAMNPDVHVVAYETRLTASNASAILEGWDVVVDATDNFSARYLLSDACTLLGIPDVHGGISGFEGQVTVFCHDGGPCYRCLFPVPPSADVAPTCEEAGVLGVLPGIVGTIQATEALKLIIGRGTPLVGRLLVVDALDMRFRELRVGRDPACPSCGASAELRTLVDIDEQCARPDEISARGLREVITRGEKVLILDVRGPAEASAGRIPGSVLVPLDELPAWIPELGRPPRIVAYCRSGIRGARAVHALWEAGFPEARNLRGGFEAWRALADATGSPSVG